MSVRSTRPDELSDQIADLAPSAVIEPVIAPKKIEKVPLLLRDKPR